MKYIFTSLFILSLFAVNAHAQSLSIIKKSADSVEADFFTEMDGKVTIENISANTNVYGVERVEIDMTPGHTSYFCWNIDCYNVDVSISTSFTSLMPGQQDSTFYGYLTPYDSLGGIVGTSVVKYIFFNQSASSDTVSTVFVYTATSNTSGINTRVLSDNDFYAYPNPTQNTLNIAYGDIKDFNNGRIIVRNALGSELINSSFDLNSNLTSVDVSKLERGVYFYTVQLDGQKFQTKKFAVSK